MKKYDVVVIGNGPIGLSTATLLAKQNIKVAILCGRKHDKILNSPARLFAISHGSRQILKQMNVNSTLEAYAQNINHIRIVDDDSHAKVDFFPNDVGLNNFGYMIDENILISTLQENVMQLNIDIYDSYENFSIDFDRFFAKISLNNQILCASLVIAADGRNSTVRNKLNIQTQILNYNQTAIVIDIRHSNWPHNGVAIEKFTPNGPFAILPKYEENGTTSSLVWVERGNITYESLCALNERILKDLILRKLNDYLGEIELISQPLLYSLTLVQSQHRYKERVVLVGDAAQGVHPIAGQGFNLGLRDVFELYNRVCNEFSIGLDIGSQLFLKNYSKSRELDVSKMICSTTMLNYLFANDILPIKLMRRLGLKVFDKLKFLKKVSMKYASGI